MEKNKVCVVEIRTQAGGIPPSLTSPGRISASAGPSAFSEPGTGAQTGLGKGWHCCCGVESLGGQRPSTHWIWNREGTRWFKSLSLSSWRTTCVYQVHLQLGPVKEYVSPFPTSHISLFAMTRERDKLCLSLGKEHHSRTKPYPLLLSHQGSNIYRTESFVIYIAKVVPVMCYPAQTRIAAKNRNCTHK